MKFNLDEQNKKLALALFLAGSGIVLLSFILNNVAFIFWLFKKVLDIMFPFICGFIFAFFLVPLLKFFEKHLNKCTNFKKSTIRFISVSLCLLFFLLCIISVVSLILPSLISSISKLSIQVSEYLENNSKHGLPFINNLGLDKFFEDWLKNDGQKLILNILDYLKNVMPMLLDYSLSFISKFFGTLIGIIVMVYGLIFKDRLSYQLKAVAYAFLPKKFCDETLEVLRFSQVIFNSFVIGKLIDSLIIGIICFVFMSIFNLEYALLISTIVGVTNVIPVFGPFIGAVPGLIILLIFNPIQALIFAVWILVLQQFDGNILGPYILGDKVGLPSLWVLFAIIVGGGIFGLFGMFIGIPCFAVFYSLMKKVVFKRLEERKINLEV